MYPENRKLRTARVNTDLSINDMAYILDLSPSSLSKYECGHTKPTREVLYGYHVLTQMPFKKLQMPFFFSLIDTITSRITDLISDLEADKTTPKLKYRIEKLNELLKNISGVKNGDNEEPKYGPPDFNPIS